MLEQRIINTVDTIARGNAVSHNLNHNRYAFFNCINAEHITQIKYTVAGMTNKYKYFIIIGFGGSINAGMAFAALRQHNITFIDNIDPDSTTDKIANINNCKETLVICISKSGKSEEVLLLYKIFLAHFEKHDCKKNFTIITSKNNNLLHKKAIAASHQVINHPEDIGGRFSYLSIVGLLVAALAGIDIISVCQGARKAINNYLLGKCEKNQYCSQLALLMLKKTLNTSITMVYCDRLRPFQQWLEQLWAESLGKDGMGSTPVSCSGTRDQHSQLQLYLANPHGRNFNVITCNKFYEDNFNLSEAYARHAESIIDYLAATGSLTRVIKIDELTAFSLGQLMTEMVLEVLICADYMEIDPFDQQQVEKIKNSGYSSIVMKSNNFAKES